MPLTALALLAVLGGCGSDGLAPDGGDGAEDGTAPDAGLGFDPGVAHGCPAGMARIDQFCVDRWEAYVVELQGDAEVAHSAYEVVEAGVSVRAKTARGVTPQGYVSQLQAAAACANAGKRLCTPEEFSSACRGVDAGNTYPYGGTARIPGACNEGKGSSMPRFFGSDPAKWTYAEFNDPRLNQWEGGLAPTGAYPQCVSPYGVWDCVGNLHEWGADPPDAKNHGRFRGGFYGDAELNGHGCAYVTSAHELTYHDYSTGMRCCRDALR